MSILHTLKPFCRGSSDLHNRPKVYFLCHEADYARYFESIANEILDICPNAVIYSDDPNGKVVDESHRRFDLSTMNLFVVPVTTNLLTHRDCRALVEFHLAEELKVPVLPLMQEGGLAELFNKVCGKLQFLDKTAHDPTAIPYEEKLKKYLKSVLLSDETIERIQKAFDAYIFLSYRKKDREYAQKLMRLIHANEFCRDIAIWYDEFLTPGENFETSIECAMDKSRFLALAVTPNLVSETNYVMTVEYPEARKKGKPVLPAEVVPTDADELKKHYPEIPDAVKAENAPLLSDTLKQMLEGIALKENDTDPTHNFLIGLAYLSGIDVEVDHARAVKLITSAAEADLEEAIEKLVEIYRSGEGVERNYDTAIEWQRRLAGLKKQQYKKSGTEEDGCRYLSALGKLGDFVFELHRNANKDAEAVYTELMQESEALLERYPIYLERLRESETLSDNHSTLFKAQSRADSFKLYLNLDKRTEAESSERLRENETLPKRYPPVGIRKCYAFACIKIGDVREAYGDLKGAENEYSRAFSIYQDIARETDTPEAQRDVLIAQERNFRINVATGNTLNALLNQTYTGTTLDRKDGSVEARLNLALNTMQFGDIFGMRGNSLLPKQCYYEDALKMMEPLAAETGRPSIRQTLATVYLTLSDLRERQNDPDGAEKYCRSAFEITEALAKETETIEARRNLMITYHQFGNISKARGDVDGAEGDYKRAFEIAEAVFKETGTREARRDLGVCYSHFGDLRKARGDLVGAEDFYRQALAISEALAEEAGTPNARKELAQVYWDLGAIRTAQGDPRSAEEYYLRAVDIQEEVVCELRDGEKHYRLGCACYQLAKESKWSRRRRYLKKARSIFVTLLQKRLYDPDIRRKCEEALRKLPKF